MTSALFDSAAQNYDNTFTNTEIGKLQRARVWKYLDSILPNNSLNILELNCGTGEDAIWFAKKGHKVWATDISKKMVEITRLKVEQFNLSDKIIVEQLDINEINKANFPNRFDLVLSNFGGLNCLTDNKLTVLSQRLKNLLTSTGRFVAVVMPNFCMTESLYFLSKFKFKEVFRRKKMQTVNVGNALINTYYYNSKSFYGYFKNEFDLNKTVSVGLTIPPSYLNNFFAKKVNTLNFLNETENLFGNNIFSASISDHYLTDLIIKK
jgi:ubiquinone/menaquinone biosynthesis C-methylase UbiE